MAGLWIAGLLVSPLGTAKEVDLVKVAYIQATDIDDPIYYYQRLLLLALEKTRPSHGEYQVVYATKIESVDRIHQLVQTGDQANLIWASVTPARAQTLRFIPFDMLRGYNSLRLLLIHSENTEVFSKIKTREDFLSFRAGNGSNWTDTHILKANGVHVETAVGFDSLLKMLAAGRFDYISRGLHEVHNDLIRYRGQGYPVAIDEYLLLEYQHPVPYSFFVSPNQSRLAERLELGLKQAEKDGSFAELFNSIPAFQRATAELAKERVRIRIDNSLAVAPAS